MPCLLESVREEAKVSEWNKEQLEGIEEEQPEQSRAQSKDEQAVTGGVGEVRSGRGNEHSAKGKGKENGNKGSLGSNGTQEAQQNTRTEKEADEDEGGQRT